MKSNGQANSISRNHVHPLYFDSASRWVNDLQSDENDFCNGYALIKATRGDSLVESLRVALTNVHGINSYWQKR